MMFNDNKKNKRGQGMFGILFVVLMLIIILFIGFIMVVGSSVTNWVADEVVPELSGLGMVGDANLTEISEYTIAPVNTFIQSFTWLTGVLFVLMLLASLGVAFSMRVNPSGWLIGFYFMLVIILVIVAVFMSNIYQDFYTDTGELADRMKEHTMLSYLILYSPLIYAIIGFVTGIIIFSGRQEESYV